LDERVAKNKDLHAEDPINVRQVKMPRNGIK